ncbi:MAG: hypothetical protein JW925_09460 [Syntrophaceae bacterium]|nr:hypothetical protein [Syntrophaceae bacterium]
MAISTSTLFDFTAKAEHLISILENEFRPRFCLEHRRELNPLESFLLNDEAIPMVCFCDLPLSTIAPHLEFFGNYGLGLTKEWGIQNGLNPVMYMSNVSYLNQYILHTLMK